MSAIHLNTVHSCLFDSVLINVFPSLKLCCYVKCPTKWDTPLRSGFYYLRKWDPRTVKEFLPKALVDGTEWMSPAVLLTSGPCGDTHEHTALSWLYTLSATWFFQIFPPAICTSPVATSASSFLSCRRFQEWEDALPDPCPLGGMLSTVPLYSLLFLPISWYPNSDPLLAPSCASSCWLQNNVGMSVSDGLMVRGPEVC